MNISIREAKSDGQYSYNCMMIDYPADMASDIIKKEYAEE
jgi:hypothetical protein